MANEDNIKFAQVEAAIVHIQFTCVDAVLHLLCRMW